MVKKALMITSFAAGYVLGAKAGRERYEQIRTAFLRVKADPMVREKVHQAVHAVRHTQEDEVDLRPHGASLQTEPFARRFG